MKKLLILAAAAALGFTSCTENEVVVDRYQDNAIEFGTYTGNAVTKGVVTNDDNLLNFGVTAFYTGLQTWAEANPSTVTEGTELPVPNFMYDQTVSRGDKTASWGYSPIKYWPTMLNHKISFFAYAPQQDLTAKDVTSAVGTSKSVVLSKNNVAGTPTVTVTIPETTAEMVDFVADAVIDRVHAKDNTLDPVDASVVKFNMRHEMTRLSIWAKLDETLEATKDAEGQYNSTVVITSIKFNADADNAFYYQKGVYTFPNANEEENGVPVRGAWSFDNIDKEALELGKYLNFKNAQTYNGKTYGTADEPVLTLGLNTATSTNLIAQSEGAAEQYLFFIPPAGTNGIAANQTITVSYDIVTADTALTSQWSCTSATKQVTLPAGFFKQGVAYKIELTFDVDDIVLEADVVKWDEENYTGSVGYGSDNQTATQVVPPAEK